MEKILAAVDLSTELDEGTKNIPRGEFQLGNILNYVYVFMGMLAVIVIVYNAIAYLTSQGEPSRTQKATQGLIFAAIGLAIVLLAAVITNFIFTTIGGAK